MSIRLLPGSLARPQLVLALVLALVAALGCTLSPRQGTLLDSRGQAFPVDVFYPADNPALAGTLPVFTETTSVTVEVVLPGKDPRQLGDCFFRVPPITTLNCDVAMPIRIAGVRLNRDTGTPAEIGEDPRTSPGVAQPVPGGFIVDTPGFEFGQSVLSLSTSPTGERLIHATVLNVRIANHLWQSCSTAGVSCPPGAAFFARLRPVIRYATGLSFLLGRQYFDVNSELQPQPTSFTRTFEAGDAANTCITQNFIQGGSGAVSNVCHEPQDRPYVEIYARR